MKRIILIAWFGFAIGSCGSNNKSATETLSDSAIVNTAADSGKMTITGTGSNAAITDTGNQPSKSAVTLDSNSQSKVSGVAGTGASDSISRSHK